MKILCATDFSEQSLRAARVAARLAERFGDTLVLVNAIEPIMPYGPDPTISFAVSEAALREAAQRELARATNELREGKLAIEAELIDGIADQAIVRHAEKIAPRMIVLGSHGRRALARWFLGSVAERVVRHAHCPVLVVREDIDNVLSWARNTRPLNITVGLDDSSSSDSALAWLKEFRRFAPADVTFVHFYWPPQEYARLGLMGPRDVFEADPEVVRVLDRQFWDRVRDLPGEGKLDLKIKPNWGRVGDVLAMEAATENPDFLVVGTHQRGASGRLWHGSIAQGVLHASRAPVLCVPVGVSETRIPTQTPVIRTVLTPTDLSPLGNEAVRYAYAMLRGSGGMVELCYALEKDLPNPIYAHAGGQTKEGENERQEIKAQLRRLIPPDAEHHGITTHISLLEGPRAAVAICQAAERLGVDAVCMTTHGRSGLGKAVMGSVAQEVLKDCRRPVFMVRHLAR